MFATQLRLGAHHSLGCLPTCCRVAITVVLATGLGLRGPAEAAAQDYPSATISNGEIEALLFLPDSEHGFYRGTRFEWAGAFGGLEYRGHEFFSPWLAPHDPTRHEATSGPVQEFVIDGVDYSGQGFDAAAPGETFVKIGVGVLRKPDNEPYRFSRPYEIVDHGDWDVEVRADAVEYVHRIQDPSSGYAYRYSKTIRLDPDAPIMVLDHTLRNDGTYPIEGSVYNHNFMLIDGEHSGPQIVLEYPFNLNVTQTGPRPLLNVDGPRFTFARDLQPGESVRYEFDGFGDGPQDYDFTVENRRSGAGVRISGDRPLSHKVFWAVPSVISPEAYIQLQIAPGEEFGWTASYTFYTFEPDAERAPSSATF